MKDKIPKLLRVGLILCLIVGLFALAAAPASAILPGDVMVLPITSPSACATLGALTEFEIAPAPVLDAQLSSSTVSANDTIITNATVSPTAITPAPTCSPSSFWRGILKTLH